MKTEVDKLHAQISKLKDQIARRDMIIRDLKADKKKFTIGLPIIPDNLKLIKKSGDIVYIGDSTLVGENSTPKALEKLLGEPITTIAQGGYNLDLYLAYCEYLLKYKEPKLIIMTINMRSFSYRWDMNPQFQFEKERFLLEHPNIPPPLQRLSLVFVRRKGINFINKIPTVREYVEMSYVRSFTAGHRKIKSLIKIKNMLGNKALFYITPIDYGAICEYGDPTKNIELINSICNPLDLSRSLPKEEFVWDKYPNEHLTEGGREFVAKKISEVIKGR